MQWSLSLGPEGRVEIVTERPWVLVRATGRLSGTGFTDEVVQLLKPYLQFRLVLDLTGLAGYSPEVREQCVALGRHIRDQVETVTLVGEGPNLSFLMANLRLAGVVATRALSTWDLSLPPALTQTARDT